MLPAKARAAPGSSTSASPEAFQRFGETPMPILQEVGVDGRPEVYPAQPFVSA